MALADLLKNSGTYINWETQGNTPVVGTINSISERQSRKFQTDEMDFWDDGSAKMQWVINLATDHRNDDPDDDGTRIIIINQWSGQKKSMTIAMREYVDEPVTGDGFTATWSSGIGRAGDPRTFTYTFKKGSTGSLGSLTHLVTEKNPPVEDPWVLAEETPAAAVSKEPNPADTARMLLTSGIAANEVAAITGLSMKIVNALAAQITN